MTYAAARAAAADALHPGHRHPAAHAQQHFGAIEYCKAILHRHAALTPLALPRHWRGARRLGAGAHAGTPMASASFLRGLPQPDWEPFVPARAAELYGRAAADGLLLDGARLETAVLALLRMQDPANFAQVRGVSEGLENPPDRRRAGSRQPRRPLHPLENPSAIPMRVCGGWCLTRRLASRQNCQCRRTCMCWEHAKRRCRV